MPCRAAPAHSRQTISASSASAQSSSKKAETPSAWDDSWPVIFQPVDAINASSARPHSSATPSTLPR